jgi:protein-S-isoprenylcysteine O-methyltransferase Ste14
MDAVDVMVLISLGLFYLLMFGRTVLLYRQGIKVWVIGTSAKNFFEAVLEKFMLPAALCASSILILLAAVRADLPLLLTGLVELPWLKYAGLVLCYGGLVIFLLALCSFGLAWRIGIDEHHSNTLITTGVFKYSRNPIFLFMDLYFAGVLLIYPAPAFLLLTLLTVVGIHLQILREEKFLANKFGEQYSAYKNKTRRYL